MSTNRPSSVPDGSSTLEERAVDSSGSPERPKESERDMTRRTERSQTEREADEDEEEEEGEEEDATSAHNHARPSEQEDEEAPAPPLPDEEPPPLPSEAPPGQEDDGWEPVWDGNAQSYYFYNRFTGVSQWENPRVPDAQSTQVPPAPGTEPAPPQKAASPVVGGYNPAIHGDYDPTAPYAQQYEQPVEPTAHAAAPGMEPGPGAEYAAAGAFNRFTGRWQAMDVTPEAHNDENKSRRQMNAFFDVDAAANSHDGRSLRAERSAKKLSKKELKVFKDKRREKKEEKRRAWLRD